MHFTTSFVTLLSAGSLIAASTFDCKNIVVKDKKFNFGALAGHRSVSFIQDSSLELQNTTYTVDICGEVPRDKNLPKGKQCGKGTRICAVERSWSKEDGDSEKLGEEEIRSVREIARLNVYENRHLEPKFELLGGDSDDDKDNQGVRIELRGGKWQSRKQTAIIEMICQQKSEGEEGESEKSSHEENEAAKEGDQDKSDDKKEKDGKDESKGPQEGTWNITKHGPATGSWRLKRDDDEPKENPEWEALRHVSDNHGGTLSFISFDSSTENGDTLRLEWKTKYACESYDGDDDPSPDDDDDSSPSKGGWGFFSWVFFIFFVGGGGYMAFFAWLNYSKYGARGWDLVPHADTIRDVPYILGDLGRKVGSSIAGGGSRGGYSAV